jgi:hypothetical protein
MQMILTVSNFKNQKEAKHDIGSVLELKNVIKKLNVKSLTGSLRLNNGSLLVFSNISDSDIISVLSESSELYFGAVNEKSFRTSKALQ